MPHGEWEVNYPYHAEKLQDFLDNIKEKDPFAIALTGEDLAHGSFLNVYDRILNERLRAEYENAVFTNTNLNEFKALIYLVEENIGEFSSEVTDYLTMYDRPLAALYEMTNIKLVSENPDFDYDHDKIGEFVDAVSEQAPKELNARNSTLLLIQSARRRLK